MRIFYITSVLGNIGGSEIYTRDLIQEMVRRGHEVFVFSTADYKIPGTRSYVCKTWGHHALFKWEGLLYWQKALALAKEFKPDVIQSHSNSMMGLLGHYLKNKLKVPHFLLIELISSQNKNIHTKTIFQWEKFFLPKLNYDKIIVWTQRMKEKFLKPWGVEEEKIEVIPAAIDINNYPLDADGREFTEKYGKNLITSFKGLWGSNALGLKYVINAMRIVRERHPGWHYVIFGGGDEEQNLRDYVKRAGLDDVISFTSGLLPENGPRIAAATKIAPHSFVYEFSTSVSLLEYMAWGKACVVTDIGAVKEFVGDAALTVKAMDEKAMAEGIIKLIENPGLRKELERKARARVEKRYSIQSTVDRLEGMYKKALGAKA